MKYTAATLAAAFGYASAAMQYGGSSSSSTVPAYPVSTCPAAGTTTSDGKYSCNPAHAYPAGQYCTLEDGCYYLRTVAPGYSTSATSPASPSSTCPAPGTTGTNGGYSCNPAHQYPEGQYCTLENGCYYLRTTAPGYSTSVPAYMPMTTIVCPGPTTVTTAGTTYPVTAATTLTVPCHECQMTSAPAASTPPAYTPPAAASTSCPAAGSTNSMGQYSCNPAHQYPEGQTCVFTNGCPYLVYASSSTAGAYQPPATMAPSATHPANATTPPLTPYTGAGSQVLAAGAPLAAIVLGALFM